LVDADGNSYVPEVLAVPGLTLEDLLQEVIVTRCGFSAVDGDLPTRDWPIQQYRVPPGGRLYDGLKGFLGVYPHAIRPLGDVLWITDTTIEQPDALPAPRTITLDQAMSINLGTEKQKLDAFRLIYSGLENNYDYTTFKYEYPLDATPTTVTETERISIEFRKRTSPITNVVVRTALNIENKRTLQSGVEIDNASDVYEFDSKGRLEHRRNTMQKLLPDSGLGYAANSLQNFGLETDEYGYAPHPFKPRSDYVQRRLRTSEGLVATDSINRNPNGSEIVMDYVTAVRSAFVTTDTTLSTRLFKTQSETAEPLRDGNVRVRERIVDELNSLVIKDASEDRPGEISVSGQTTSSEELLVYAVAGATRSSEDIIEDLNIAELPIKFGIPLARRIIKQRQADRGTLNLPVLGYDETLVKALPVKVFDRDGIYELGTFLISGRTIVVNALGVITTFTGKTMVTGTFPFEEIERYARTINSLEELTCEFDFDCLTGYGLGIDPSIIPPHLTIEARHADRFPPPWTNLKEMDLDVSEWDGSNEPFELRITAGTVAAVTREQFIFRIGPITVPDIPVLIGFGDESASSSSTLVIPVVIPFGSNKILIVAVGNRNQGIPTGVTYGVTPMTALASSPGAIGTRMSLWWLIDPPEGSDSITATFGTSQLDMTGIYEVYRNVSQTTPFSNSRAAALGGANPDMDVSDFTGKLIVDFINKWGEISVTPKHDPIPGDGQTLIDLKYNAVTDVQAVASSDSLLGDTDDMDWTISPITGNSNFSQIAVGLNTFAQIGS
jgi:hypothetical protein